MIDREVECGLEERFDVADDLLGGQRAVAEDVDLPQLTPVLVGADPCADDPREGLEQSVDLRWIEIRHASPDGGCWVAAVYSGARIPSKQEACSAVGFRRSSPRSGSPTIPGGVIPQGEDPAV